MKNKIDISNWKNYNLKNDLGFKIYHGQRITKAARTKGDIPLLTAGKINQGVVSYIDAPLCEYNNSITVDMFGNCFYHNGKYSGDDNIYFFVNDNISENSKLYIVSVISKKTFGCFSYTDQFRQNDAENLSIELPTTIDNEPDWNYMDNYIDTIKKATKKALRVLNKSSEINAKMINITTWKNFHLYDLFEIDSGTKMDRIAMKYDNPTINFVGRSGINNGVTAVVDRIERYKPFKAGNLTLALGGAYLGSCFVQKEDFYTSQNVIVLIPKEDISFAAKQFICSVIFKEGNTHYKAFIDELNRHIKTDFSIKLPVDINGNPDYELMDKYMSKIMNRINYKYSCLKRI